MPGLSVIFGTSEGALLDTSEGIGAVLSFLMSVISASTTDNIAGLRLKEFRKSVRITCKVRCRYQREKAGAWCAQCASPIDVEMQRGAFACHDVFLSGVDENAWPTNYML